jgi:hypothetical protein
VTLLATFAQRERRGGWKESLFSNSPAFSRLFWAHYLSLPRHSHPQRSALLKPAGIAIDANPNLRRPRGHAECFSIAAQVFVPPPPRRFRIALEAVEPRAIRSQAATVCYRLPSFVWRLVAPRHLSAPAPTLDPSSSTLSMPQSDPSVFYFV